MPSIKNPRVVVLAILSISALFLIIYATFQKSSTPISSTTPTITPSPTATPTPTATPSLTPTPTPKPAGPCVNLPVLMYHHLTTSETAKTGGYGYLNVTPETFEKHLAYLNDKHYNSISPSQLIAFIDSGTPLPSKPILITFDDGYDDFATYAAPLLAQYSIKATVFIPTGLMENPGYLNWSTIKSLSGKGVYFGNHSWSHQNMGTSLEKIKKEIDTAQTQLSERGQDPNKVFAYPYGIVSTNATNYLKEAGYALAFTTVNGRLACKGNRLTIPRIRIGNSSLSSYGL